MCHVNDRGHHIRFVWIQSHGGIPSYDGADRHATSACDKQSVDIDLGVPLTRLSHIIKTSFKEGLTEVITCLNGLEALA